MVVQQLSFNAPTKATIRASLYLVGVWEVGERREEEEEEACVAGREGGGGLGEVVLAAAALTAK